jgi:hypothetical protein
VVKHQYVNRFLNMNIRIYGSAATRKMFRFDKKFNSNIVFTFLFKFGLYLKKKLIQFKLILRIIKAAIGSKTIYFVYFEKNIGNEFQLAEFDLFTCLTCK